MKQKEETYAKLMPHESHKLELYPFINPLSKLYSESYEFFSHNFPELPPLQNDL